MIHFHKNDPFQNNDPFTLFRAWMAEAKKTETLDPNAMALSTVDAQGRPSIRIVLLKDIDDQGLIFYTNLESKKSQDLKHNRHVALCFYWKSLQRQICIQGQVTQVSEQKTQAYFKTRPRVSQIGAWASRQSQLMDDAKDLERRVTFYTQQFADQDVPCPKHWGGFCVIPERIEFWSDKPFRLHERFVYDKNLGHWSIHRLFP